MANEKPGWWWNFWYSLDEAKKAEKEREEKVKRYDSSCRWECLKKDIQNQVNNIIYKK